MTKVAKIGTVSLQDIMAGASITVNLRSDPQGFEGTFIQCCLTEVGPYTCKRAHRVLCSLYGIISYWKLSKKPLEKLLDFTLLPEACLSETLSSFEFRVSACVRT